MISAIEDWLRSSMDFRKGVELYSVHGTNDTFKKLFAGAESSFTRDRLRKELKTISEAAIATHPQPKNKLVPLKDLTPKSESKFIHIDVAKLPEDLKELNREKNALFKQAVLAFELMKDARTEDLRYAFALTIIENFDKTDKIFKELELFQTTGRRSNDPAPDPESLENLNGLELAAKLDNLKKNISKIAKDPKKKEKHEQLQLKRKEVEDALLSR